MLIGALNPDYIDVRAIADIRPYSIHRAFHGDWESPGAHAARPGLMEVYGWKTEDEARKNVKVFEGEKGNYKELLDDPNLDIEAVIIAMPLHLHDAAAIDAMRKGKHVLTEKLMAHSVAQCKEMGAGRGGDEQDSGGRPSAALQHSVRQRGRADQAWADWRHSPHPSPVASGEHAGQRQLATAAARGGQLFAGRFRGRAQGGGC